MPHPDGKQAFACESEELRGRAGLDTPVCHMSVRAWAQRGPPRGQRARRARGLVLHLAGAELDTVQTEETKASPRLVGNLRRFSFYKKSSRRYRHTTRLQNLLFIPQPLTLSSSHHPPTHPSLHPSIRSPTSPVPGAPLRHSLLSGETGVQTSQTRRAVVTVQSSLGDPEEGQFNLPCLRVRDWVRRDSSRDRAGSTGG